FRDKPGASGAHDLVDTIGGIRLRRVTAFQFMRPFDFGRVYMRYRHLLKRAIANCHVHRTPVCNRRNRQPRYTVECRLIVERRSQHDADFVEEVLFILRTLALGDVDARADISSELSAGVEAWHAVIVYPAVFAVGPAESVLYLKPLAGLEGPQVAIQVALVVSGMNALRPAVTQFLLHAASRKFQPGSVEVIAPGIHAGRPDHDGGGVGHHTEARFAFGQCSFGTPALGNVSEHQDSAEQTALAVTDRRAAVIDGVLHTILTDQHGVIGKADDQPLAQHTLYRVGHRLAGLLIDDMKNLFDVAPGSIGLCPAGQTLRHRVNESYTAAGIGGDDSIADAGERDAQALALFAHFSVQQRIMDGQ